jgi:TRAP transporter TAXI family solute receptor
MMVVALLAASMTAPLLAQTPPEAQRISFQISTGPVSGTYLRVGETIAYIISNPPGIGRCEDDTVCGPTGLIATSRSSSGSVTNAIAVNSGRVTSALVQGDIAHAAFEGTGPFKASGALKNLRAIARLHDETMHLVVGSRSRIRRLNDLAGKRVAIDSAKAATNFTVRSLLAAAKLSSRRLRLSFQTADQAAADLRDGKIDAYFVIGALPIRSVDNLLRRGQARVIGIDTRVIATLVKQDPMLTKVELPADTYRGSKAIATFSVASLWVVNKSMPDDLVHGILRALWNPLNRNELKRLGPIADSIRVEKAAENLPIPLHDGAQRFYAEAGR